MVFATINWNTRESALLRTALKAHGGEVSRVSWNELVFAEVVLKLAAAIEASPYTQEELEKIVWQNS
jgi:hypothetical protein